jgi:hypothetical protein
LLLYSVSVNIIRYRGVEQSGQLVWLITTRSQVQILPPQPRKIPELFVQDFFLVTESEFGSATPADGGIVAGS